MARRFKEHYQRALRRRAVRGFVEENSMTPSRPQMFELMQEKGYILPMYVEHCLLTVSCNVPLYGSRKPPVTTTHSSSERKR